MEKPISTMEIIAADYFKQASLDQLRKLLEQQHYPGYPTERLSSAELAQDSLGRVIIPEGPWSTESTPALTERWLGRTDSMNRPLHPWFDDMLRDERIGVLTGRGYYWNYGPNPTSDAIILRHDQSIPYVKLIKRGDTGRWGLPGGFRNKDEGGLDAAIRETHEETHLDLNALHATATHVYEGPVADLRATAHAWPVTSAWLFQLPNQYARGLTLAMEAGGDDAKESGWFAINQIPDILFGSHRVLLDSALAAAYDRTT